LKHCPAHGHRELEGDDDRIMYAKDDLATRGAYRRRNLPVSEG
jgi:hypothetical protein